MLRDRRVLAEEGVVVVVVAVDVETGAIITGPEIITRGWVYAPEAEDLLDECADAVARRGQGGVRRTTPPTSRPSSGSCAGPPAASSTTAPSASPMIVPVVMEA